MTHSTHAVAGKKPPLPLPFFYGWVIAGIAALTQAVVFGFRFVFAIAFIPLLHEFGWDRATTASIVSVHVLAYGAMVPFAGAVVDRIGARVIVPIGVALATASVLATSLATELWQFYLFMGVGAAAGAAMSGYIPNFVLVSTWFMRRRAAAFGIALAGNGASFLLASLGQLLIESMGWRAALFTLGATFGGLTLLITALFLRRRPEDVGQFIDGERSATTLRADQPGRQLRVVDQAWARRVWTARAALSTPKFWCLFGANFLAWGIANSMLTQHHAAYALDSRHPPAAIAVMVALYGTGVVAGNLSGFLADRYGREATYTAGCGLIGSGLVALMLAANPGGGWALAAYAMLFGYGFGLISPTSTAAVVDVFQGPHLGAINGLIVVSFGIGGSFSPWLGGFIFDQTGSYLPAFCLAVGAVAAAATLLWLARPSAVRAVGPPPAK